MMLARTALMISALALVGCERGPIDETSRRPRPRLSMTPADPTSAVGMTPLQVVVDNHAEAVGSALLAPIATQIRLVSWPEGAPVPVTTQLQEFEPRRENGYQVLGSGTITVTPSAPLEDRWYFLHLAEAPPDVELAGAMQLRKLADGRAGARFTPGSDPRMTWVRRCLGEGTSGKVVVDFSESVMLDSAESLTVEASGACSRPSSGNDGDRVGKSFSFACDGVGKNSPIRVLVASTVTGAGGRSVRGAGLQTEFPSAAFEPVADCLAAAVATE